MTIVYKNGVLIEERRKFERVRSEQLLELRFDLSSSACQLLDVSSRGAKLCIPTGLVPNVGGRVSMQLLDGTDLAGQIRWTGTQSLGVVFDDFIRDLDRFQFPDDIDQLVFIRIARLQERLRKAR